MNGIYIIITAETIFQTPKYVREYLNDYKTRELEGGLEKMFWGMVEFPRIRHGSRQTVETLINEEAKLLAKYLRDERKSWIPRITGASMNYGSNFLKYVEIHYACKLGVSLWERKRPSFLSSF